ncbi:MAG: hypothetical protein P1V51_02995 [Deltaproteobacteria bacterium]|nr:hypothetical protein [Deltaproteobacteria bacterium]
MSASRQDAGASAGRSERPASLVSSSYTLRLDEAEGGWLTSSWLGRIGDRHPSVSIQPYLESLMDHAFEGGLGLHFRLEELQHFNSSTIAVLVRLIHRIPERQGKLRITFDPDKSWQQMCCDVLARFEASVPGLEVREIRS